MKLQEYRKAEQDYFDLLKKQRKEMQPISDAYFRLQKEFYDDIRENKIYLPITELAKYLGEVKSVCIVTTTDIETDIFDGYTLTEGVFSHPFGSRYYYSYDIANKYDLIDDEYGYIGETIEAVGFYDLDLGEGIIPETNIDSLIHEFLMKTEETPCYEV